MSGRFENVIIQPGFNRLHRNLFIAAAGEHDHRAIWPAHLDGEQHGNSVAPAQLIVGHHQVKARGFDGLSQFFRGDGLPELAVGKLPVDLPPRQRAVVGIVIHNQDL